jgi:hypothetical protein
LHIINNNQEAKGSDGKDEVASLPISEDDVVTNNYRRIGLLGDGDFGIGIGIGIDDPRGRIVGP